MNNTVNQTIKRINNQGNKVSRQTITPQITTITHHKQQANKAMHQQNNNKSKSQTQGNTKYGTHKPNKSNQPQKIKQRRGTSKPNQINQQRHVKHHQTQQFIQSNSNTPTKSVNQNNHQSKQPKTSS